MCVCVLQVFVLIGPIMRGQFQDDKRSEEINKKPEAYMNIDIQSL